MTASLPTVGGSNNIWGTQMNQFLGVSHNSDGTLIPSAVSSALPLSSGSIIIGALAGGYQQLAIGATGTVLTSSAGQPAWLALAGMTVLSPSGGDDTTAIQAAVNGSVIVVLNSGTFNVSSTITVPSKASILGVGASTRINASQASGGAFYWHGASGEGGVTATNSKGVMRDFVIDGTSAGANAIGLDMGDGWGYRLDHIFIENFTGANAKGLYINNAQYFTEKMVATGVTVRNCTTLVWMSVTGGLNSFEFCDLAFYFAAQPGQTGFRIDNGAYLNGSLTLRGNFYGLQGGTYSTRPAAIWIGNGSSDGSTLSSLRWDVVIETDVKSGPPTTDYHQSIHFADSSNKLQDGIGILAFRDPNWVASNVTTGKFTFNGILYGDSALNAAVQIPADWAIPPGYTVTLPVGGTGDDGANISAVAAAAHNSAADAYMGGAGQQSGLVVLAPNQVYNVKTTITLPPGCELWGNRGTILAYSGTGPCIQAQGNEVGTPLLGIQGMGSRIISCTVDGSAVSPTAMAGGIEVGGQYDIVLQDVTVQNFTSSGTDNALAAPGGGNFNYGGYFPLGAYGISICNRNTLTEKVIFKNVTINNCGTPNLSTTPPSQAGGAGIQVINPKGGAQSGSQMYAFMDVHMNQQQGQNGLVLGRNAQLYYCSLRMKGNMFSTGSGTNGGAVFVIGVGDNVNNYNAHMSLANYDINIECTGGGSTSSKPFTVWFGQNSDNTWNNGFGTMRFAGMRSATNSPQFTYQVGANGTPSMQFSGRIWGDTGLAAVANPVATPAFNTLYTNNGNDAVVYVSGTGITNVVVSGVATGLTSGAFILPTSQTIQINGGSGTPAWKWITNVINS